MVDTGRRSVQSALPLAVLDGPEHAPAGSMRPQPLAAPRGSRLSRIQNDGSEAHVSNQGSRANGPSGASQARSAGRPLDRRGGTQPSTGAGGPAQNGDRHQIHLAGGRDAASGARAAIDLLTVGLFDEVGREHIRLMVSELVGNSVRHGGADAWQDGIELTVFVDPTAMRVECSDPIAGFDVPP